jgi:hypothetical protein
MQKGRRVAMPSPFPGMDPWLESAARITTHPPAAVVHFAA